MRRKTSPSGILSRPRAHCSSTSNKNQGPCFARVHRPGVISFWKMFSKQQPKPEVRARAKSIFKKHISKQWSPKQGVPFLHANMDNVATFVTDTTMVLILCVVIVTGLSAIKLSLCTSLDTHQKFNKYVVPDFPCEGTLFILARDGVLCVVPERKAVVKTDMVREVHCGRVARSCDQHGNFAYFEHDDDHG